MGTIKNDNIGPAEESTAHPRDSLALRQFLEMLLGILDGLPNASPNLYAGCMPWAEGAKFWLNSAICASVRDRGVGGSNPLAPTNFLKFPNKFSHLLSATVGY